MNLEKHQIDLSSDCKHIAGLLLQNSESKALCENETSINAVAKNIAYDALTRNDETTYQACIRIARAIDLDNYEANPSNWDSEWKRSVFPKEDYDIL